jgi:DNA-binding MarR family transcriptional regulator
MYSDGMPAPVAKRLGYALKRAQHALRVSMDEALRPLALTTPQYAVLCAVEAEAGLSNARLARAAFVTAQAMQGVLANLERDGLLERQADPTHGRVLRSELTDHGRDALARAHDAVRVVEDRMIASIGAKAAIRLAASLSKCADDLRAPLEAG